MLEAQGVMHYASRDVDGIAGLSTMGVSSSTWDTESVHRTSGAVVPSSTCCRGKLVVSVGSGKIVESMGHKFSETH